MGLSDNNEENIFETEAAWSFANKKILCLDSGSWRTARPIISSELCNRCGICYSFCPPQCIQIDEAWENFIPNLDYCKGCGVCAKECPTDAIEMTPEGEYTDECSNK